MDKVITQTQHFFEQLYAFRVNNIYFTIVCIGVFIPLGILILYHLKKLFLSDTTIIHRAERKSHTEKKLIPLKPIKKITARIVGKTSQKKKYMLVSYEEWQEFSNYKERLKKNQSSQSS